MAFSEVCRICLRVNIRLCVLKKTSLRILYKILTNCLMDEDEEPIIVCFICHAKLIRCRTLQQQAIESNAVLEQLLAGGSMSIPKPHEARDEIHFTPIYHIDIWPVECDIENDCKDDIFSLESVKVEEEKIKNENFKFEVNWSHETDTAEKQEDSEIDAFEDRHKDLEDNLPLIAFGAKSKTDDVDIAPSEKKVKSNSTDSKINVVRQDDLDFEGPTIKSNLEQPGEKPFSCNICKFRSNTKSNLKKHTKIHTGEKPFSCNICKFRCITKRDLQRHTIIHTGEKPFSCNICEFRCNTKSNLQNHMKIHTRDKPFSCNICELRCSTKRNLQRHMKIHTGEKPFSCNVCQFRFTRKDNLQTHMNKHTEEKPFSCNICEFRCNTKSNLQNHMNIHTGEKPFSCNMCELRCSTKGHLQRHMKIHTGEKPFSCNICEFRFTRKDNLQTHMNRHTEGNHFRVISVNFM